MAKQVQGSCNRCGHCGCYEGAGGPAKWYPGIGGSKMAWGRRHSGQDLDVCALIRTAFMGKFGNAWDGEYDVEVDIRIVGGGPPIDVTCYVTTSGIQTSSTDRSCPFFELGNPNLCKLWGRNQLPPSCANFPQNLDDEAAVKWEVNHPHTSAGGLCGYYWVEV